LFDLSRVRRAPPPLAKARPFVGAAAALAVTVPHALGLGLIAFAPFAQLMPVSVLALWSAALPGALLTLFSRVKGVVYAPSTAVALLFGGMLTLVMRAGAGQGITVGQALAITGVFVALGFFMQWLIGRARLAGLARFIPLSVTQGFAAGVGLSLVLTQLHSAMGAGSWLWQPALAWHLGIAGLVVLLSVVLQRLWPRFPSLLMALLLVSVPVLWLAPPDLLQMAATPHDLMLLPLPDWLDAPWWTVIGQAGVPLITLSLLMAVVNGLEVLVFHQQLEAEHGVRASPDEVLRRESALSALCALFGMIPASTSTSRSRTALAYTGAPTVRVGQWHALVMLAVAMSGHLWLHWLPMAGLAGVLVMAGVRMVPAEMWRAPQNAMRRTAWGQSWLVAGLFAIAGGAMALVAGLAVSTVVLLRTSGAHVIRRMHLHGELRSRHIRRADTEAWLAGRMNRVAVFELQGILSFGVAALVVDQVRIHLERRQCVILDTSRVPSWDETGYARLRTLAHELQDQGIALLISGVHGIHKQAMDDLQPFSDLDHALEWAEEQLLLECPLEARLADLPGSLLGELGEDMTEQARLALERVMVSHHYPANDLIIRSGDHDRRLMLVQAGLVTLSTAESAGKGLRLASIGPGVVFGEMAFLNGIARTAYAHANAGGARVCTLEWNSFKTWSQEYPEAALGFMKQLARMGIRRLGTTSQQLRAAME
jgi:SulP family sulfate permease